MKKMLKTEKKALSVFMAIMMLMTAWVWVAPDKASAAAGKYYVRVYYNLVDRGALDPFIGDTAVDYTGPTMTTASAGVTLYHKADNGTATGDPVATNYNMKSLMFDNDGTDGLNINNHIAFSSVGFPIEMQFFAKCGASNYGQWYFTKITVAASSTATEYTLWEGKVGCEYGGNPWQGTINVSGFTSNRKGSGTWTQTSDSSKWIYPYADTTTVNWSNTPEAMTCPKSASNSASTQSVSVTVKDQYGVQMFDPTWSVKGSNKSTGITVSPTTSSGSTTISVTSAANIAETTNSQTGTVTATWSTPNSTGNTSKTSSKTFTINDATYTATFKNHRNADGVLQSDYTTTAQYGTAPTAPTASNYSDGDYDYTFTGWSPTVSGIAADTTYTATYSNGVFVGADYSKVNEAIAAADAIKAHYGTEYELKYTLASRVALDAAINNVVTGLGRTRQDDVDGYAKAINDAITALEPNKFDVIFLDRNGAILLYEKDVEYKEAVTAPAFPDDQKVYYDSTNHYTFTGWDTDEYASVVDDLVIQPVFSAEGHTYTTETVESNCVTKGATKYVCSCGYSYIDGETDYGDHVWEADFTTDLEPTCTVAGSKSIHCSLCDAQKDITVIDPLGHNFTSQSVAVDATCGKIGIMAKVCDACGVCEHTTIEALEHDYKETVVAPTCTTKGYTEYVCQRDGCGFSYRDNFTDVTAHNYGEWETVYEAACKVAGLEKRVCEDCGFTELGSIDALAHDSVNDLSWVVVVEATCEGKGYQTKTCSKCNNIIASEEIPALSHNYTKVTTPATCTEAGSTVETCENCGDINTTVIQPTGHKYENEGAVVTVDSTCTTSAYKIYNCDNCDYKYNEYVNGSTALGHDFTGTEIVVTAATCTADGKKTVQCKNCAETTTVIIPHTGHTWGEWEVTKPATNTEDGEMKRTCSNTTCTETVEIPAGDHNWDAGTVTKAPTCTTTGTMVYKCIAENHENCGVTLEVTIPVTQHTIVQKETPATCTAPGKVEAYCSVCDTNCEKPFSTTETPVVPHTLDNGTVVAPTCTTSGYITYKCTAADCDFSYNVYDENEPAIGHTWSTDPTSKTDATCTNDGSATYKCANCTATKTETLAKLGHNYVEDTDATTTADCDTPATKTYKCSRCDNSYVEYVDVATGHKFGIWEVVTPATADKNGVQKRTCSVCQAVEYGLLAPIGDHEFTETITTAATCTIKGEKSFTCSKHTDCSANYTEEIPATGHTQQIEYTAPTCIAAGSTKIVCSVCKAEIMSETIPATDCHDFSSEGKVTTAATCGTDGVMLVECDNCDASYEKVIAKFGHSWSAWEVVTKPTATVDGVQMRKCLRAGCNETESVIIPALGGTTTYTVTFIADGKTVATQTVNHGGAATAPVISNKAPDAQYHYSYIWDKDFSRVTEDLTVTAIFTPAAHSFGNWVTDLEATCASAGSEHRDCACGYREINTIAALPHNYSIKGEKTPTCTENGYVYKICSACGNAVEETIKRLGHAMSYHEYVEPSCETDGSCAYFSCSRCGKNFADKNGSNELANVVISMKYHTFIIIEGVDATCTTNGTTDYKHCTTCGITYNSQTVAALGHVDTNGDNYCDRCDSAYLENGNIVCACSCHKVGFFNELIYKIASFFWKLFGTNKSCGCGKLHY